MCSLISPLIYRGDYRPFFTIADADFRHFQQLHDHASLNTALIIGVTNPFFLKAFDNVAHIVHVPFGTACCVHVSSTLPDDETDTSTEAPTTPMQRHGSVFSAAAALQSPSRGIILDLTFSCVYCVSHCFSHPRHCICLYASPSDASHARSITTPGCDPRTECDCRSFELAWFVLSLI
jgi:hypothetical protein